MAQLVLIYTSTEPDRNLEQMEVVFRAQKYYSRRIVCAWVRTLKDRLRFFKPRIEVRYDHREFAVVYAYQLCGEVEDEIRDLSLSSFAENFT